jgi:hypothetical protein
VGTSPRGCRLRAHGHHTASGFCPESEVCPGSVPFCKMVHARQDDVREAAFAAEDCRMSNPPCTLREHGDQQVVEWLHESTNGGDWNPANDVWPTGRSSGQPSDRVITEPYTAPKMPASTCLALRSDFSSLVCRASHRQHWRSAGGLARLGALWGSEAVLDQRPIAAMCSAAARVDALGLHASALGASGRFPSRLSASRRNVHSIDRKLGRALPTQSNSCANVRDQCTG